MLHSKPVQQNYKDFLEIRNVGWTLKLNKSKITGENTFTGDHFEIEGNHGSNKDAEVFLWVFLQTCDQ